MKLTHDFDKIDTRSRLGQQTKSVPSKWIASTYTIDFHWSHQIQIEFIVPSDNTLQTLILIVRFQPQLSYPNKMQHICLPNTSPEEKYHTSSPTNMSPIQQLNGTPFQLISRNSPTDCLSSPNVFKMVQLNLSRAHQTPSSVSTNWMHTPLYASLTVFSPKDHPFIEITSLHLYMKSNSLPLREVQISFSRTQIASYRLYHQMATSLRLSTYLTQGIKPTVVH